MTPSMSSALLEVQLDSITNVTGNDSSLFGEASEEVTGSLSYIEVLVVIVGVVLVTTILSGNGLVLVLLIRFRELRNTSNYLLLGMASADFSVGIALIATIVVRVNPHLLAEPCQCLAFWCSTFVPAITSCWTLLFVTFDRFLKIVFPLHYFAVCMRNSKTALTLVGVVYVYTIIILYILPISLTVTNTIDPVHLDSNITCWYTLSSILPSSYMEFIIYGNIMLEILLIIILYGMICRVIHDKLRRDRRLYDASAFSVFTRILQLQREIKTTKTLAVLLGLCIFGWFPLCCVLLVEIYIPSYQAGFSVRSVVGYLVFLNSALNPIVYSLRGQHFRRCTRKLICGNDENRFNNISVLIRRTSATVNPVAVIVKDPTTSIAITAPC